MANGMQPMDRIERIEAILVGILEAVFGHKPTEERPAVQLAKLEIPPVPPMVMGQTEEKPIEPEKPAAD